MGYSTFFTGAIKVTPKIDPLTCTNLNVWLNMRHCRTNELPGVTAGYPDKAWEPDGPRIPSPSILVDTFVAKHPKASVFAFDEISSYLWPPEPPLGSADDYNATCEPNISLWSNLKIYQGADCSYLAWDEGEKAYGMDDWFAFMVKLLSGMGYECEGVLRAQGEDYDDRWTLVCENGECRRTPGHEMEPTYEAERKDIMLRLETVWG